MPKTKADKLTLAIEHFVTNIYIKGTSKYSWKQALTDAGYGAGTIHSHGKSMWARAEDRIREKKEKLEIDRKWNLAWIDQKYRNLHDECVLNGDRTNEKGCLDSMSRRLSGFTDNISDKRNGDDIKIDDKTSKAVAEAARHLNLPLSTTTTGTNDD